MSNCRSLAKGWIAASLSDLTSAVGGGTPSKADPSYWTDGSIPWVSPKDMKSFHVVSSEDRLASKALDRLTLIPAESVLVVVRSGILSRTLPVALNAMPVTVNQDIRAFVPACGVSARYIALQMIAKEREILSSCSKNGTTVASIGGSALARFPFLIAPEHEQTRIVEKLEELLSDLDAGVAELKAAQKKLGQYRQSLLKAAVEGALTAEWRAQRKSPSPQPLPHQAGGASAPLSPCGRGVGGEGKPARNCCNASSPSAAPAGKPSNWPSSRNKARPRPRTGRRNTPSRCSRIPAICRNCRRGGCGRVLDQLANSLPADRAAGQITTRVLEPPSFASPEYQ